VNTFCDNNPGLSLAAAVLSLVFAFTLICCFSRTKPLNAILLAGFTLCEAYMVGGLTAHYRTKDVILAGAVTALVTVALTAYALKTKVKVEVFMAMTWVIYLAMIPLWIIGLIMQTKVLTIVYCTLGLLFYSIYLIVDTIMICGGKSMGGYGFDNEDYIVAALMLYLDIVMIFVYILKLIGSSRN